jgi:aspartate kinase
MEENISEIFALSMSLKVKLYRIPQLVLCVEDKFDNFKSLNSLLSKKFKVDFNENVLYTIRHFNDTATNSWTR